MSATNWRDGIDKADPVLCSANCAPRSPVKFNCWANRLVESLRLNVELRRAGC